MCKGPVASESMGTMRGRKEVWPEHRETRQDGRCGEGRAACCSPFTSKRCLGSSSVGALMGLRWGTDHSPWLLVGYRGWRPRSGCITVPQLEARVLSEGESSEQLCGTGEGRTEDRGEG